MLNIAVLVSGGGTNLQALIDACEKGTVKNGKIVLVISSKRDAYALERAKKHNIKTEVVERSCYEDSSHFESDILKLLRQHKIDLVVLAGFMSILGPAIVKEYANKIINVHPSLIPSFCGKGYYGLKVHKAVLDYGVKLTGATVHFVNEVPDGGPIILQKAVEVKFDDTPQILQKRVMEQAEWELLPKAVSLFCEGRLVVEGNKVNIKGGI